MTSVDRTFGGTSDNGARKRARLFDVENANRQSRIQGVMHVEIARRQRRRKPDAAGHWRHDLEGRLRPAKNIFERLITFG